MGSKWFDIWWKVLFATNIILIIFGLVIYIIGLIPETTAIFIESFTSEISFKSIRSSIRNFLQLSTAVLGATILSWGIVIIFLTLYPIKNKQKWGLYAIGVSISIWYVFDTIASITFKNLTNILLNTIVLILIGIPLICLNFAKDWEKK
ncbi:MAG: hypothetical protein GF383_11500 [Candidatus Lokiarchaeota archaeon]|nr:hypothetical protein [Candidatus Lokiarchaeota archaeon]MBD3341349.1 hypothetical protein [Candidatus Lokiarchaeota archaeon]